MTITVTHEKKPAALGCGHMRPGRAYLRVQPDEVTNSRQLYVRTNSGVIVCMTSGQTRLHSNDDRYEEVDIEIIVKEKS